MDPQQDMVIDLERLGSKRMFITEESPILKGMIKGYGRYVSSHHQGFSITIKDVCYTLVSPNALILWTKDCIYRTNT